MAERITAIARQGAPSPALTESARERAWADFVARGRDPEVAPSVLEAGIDRNLRIGGSWNEQAAGTNAIGTALAERRTIQLK